MRTEETRSAMKTDVQGIRYEVSGHNSGRLSPDAAVSPWPGREANGERAAAGLEGKTRRKAER